MRLESGAQVRELYKFQDGERVIPEYLVKRLAKDVYEVTNPRNQIFRGELFSGFANFSVEEKDF